MFSPWPDMPKRHPGLETDDVYESDTGEGMKSSRGWSSSFAYNSPPTKINSVTGE